MSEISAQKRFKKLESFKGRKVDDAMMEELTEVLVAMTREAMAELTDEGRARAHEILLMEAAEESRELTSHHDGCGLAELCHVYAADDPHPVNGANHAYVFERELTYEEACILEPDLSEAEQRGAFDDPPVVLCGGVGFQTGPRNEEGSTPGMLDGAVLAVLVDRMDAFQRGQFACAENAEILEHLHAAQCLLIRRARERKARGVLGKNEK